MFIIALAIAAHLKKFLHVASHLLYVVFRNVVAAVVKIRQPNYQAFYSCKRSNLYHWKIRALAAIEYFGKPPVSDPMEFFGLFMPAHGTSAL